MTDLNTRYTSPARRTVSASTLALLLFTLLASLVATPAANAQRVDPLEELNRGQRDQFRTYTRLFCRQFYRYGEDRFVLLPNYARDRENSTGRSVDQATEEMTLTRNVRRNGADVTLYYPPPEAEVIAAAMCLPAMDVGHYGYVSSFQVTEVIGPEEMIVRRMVLIPDEQVPGRNEERAEMRRALFQLQRQCNRKTYRLLGFRTDGLEPGDLFTGNTDRGIQVAVMSTDPQHDFVLVNYRRLRPVRTSEFAEALTYVGISPLAFIDMVRDNRERYEIDGDKNSLLAIYSRYYDRYRPARLSRVAALRPEEQPELPTTENDPDPQPQDTGEQDTADAGQGDNNADPDAGSDPPEGHGDDGSENDYDPDPDFEPGPEVDREPDPQPEPDRNPRDREAEQEEDDWEYDEGERRDQDEAPNFFGIPL